MESLENLIRTYVNLSRYQNGTGWIPTLCKICNDHGQKGNRAGFKFEGLESSFHCFNCGHSSSYDPSKKPKLSRKMRETLEAFQIPEEEWRNIVFNNSSNNVQYIKEKTEKNVIFPKKIEMPDYFYRLDVNSKDLMSRKAVDYLKKRRINLEQRFYLADCNEVNRWYGRLIIPVYNRDELVFYTGRSLIGHRKRYEKSETNGGVILYGYEKFYENFDIPLYVVEGWFDANVIDGVAVFTKKLTKPLIQMLNYSSRTKVIIPDKKQGLEMGIQALEEGWKISTPNIGNCSDINEAIQKYGKLFVLNEIRKNTYDSSGGQMMLKLYCKD